MRMSPTRHLPGSVNDAAHDRDGHAGQVAGLLADLLGHLEGNDDTGKEWWNGVCVCTGCVQVCVCVHVRKRVCV